MAHIKNAKVHNPKNVLVQIPGFISFAKWKLTKGDEVEVYLADDGESIILRPKKIYNRSSPNTEGQRMVRATT